MTTNKAANFLFYWNTTADPRHESGRAFIPLSHGKGLEEGKILIKCRRVKPKKTQLNDIIIPLFEIKIIYKNTDHSQKARTGQSISPLLASDTRRIVEKSTTSTARWCTQRA